MAYQEEHLSPPKSQPARVAVVTGEEEERNVLQVSIGYLWYTVALEIGTLWPSGQQYVALKISTLGCKPSSFSPNASGFRIKHWDSKNFPSIDRQKYYAPLQFNWCLQGTEHAPAYMYPKVGIFDLILLIFQALGWAFWQHILLQNRYTIAYMCLVQASCFYASWIVPEPAALQMSVNFKRGIISPCQWMEFFWNSIASFSGKKRDYKLKIRSIPIK